ARARGATARDRRRNASAPPQEALTRGHPSRGTALAGPPLAGPRYDRAGSPAMVPEAPLEATEHGLVPTGDGWFVLNARETRWWDREGRGAACDFEGEPQFPQFGIAVYVLGPGEPMAMYHWEADQEDFLVVWGEALLIVEGEERGLR